MARKRYEAVEEESPVEVDAATEEIPAPPVSEPKPTTKKPAENIAQTLLQLAVAAIAKHRADDRYNLTNHLDYVQYHNSAGRLVSSANKKVLTIDKTTGQYKTDTNGAMALANEVLARYKNFVESKVIASAQRGNVLVVITTDGEKYKYDLTANALTK